MAAANPQVGAQEALGGGRPRGGRSRTAARPRAGHHHRDVTEGCALIGGRVEVLGGSGQQCLKEAAAVSARSAAADSQLPRPYQRRLLCERSRVMVGWCVKENADSASINAADPAGTFSGGWKPLTDGCQVQHTLPVGGGQYSARM